MNQFFLATVLSFLVVSSTAKAEQGGPETLKIITHNVWYGFTKKAEPRHDQWLSWMAQQSPDIVVLQELNGYTKATLAKDAKAWGHDHSVLLKENGFPTGITSRFPIDGIDKIMEPMHHGLMRCRIEGIWFYVVHFHPSNFSRRIEEAGRLAEDVASLPEKDPRIILAGDFNGFSPADKEHYDGDTQLVPFFKMLDQRDAGARNLNAGRLDYGGIQAILDQGFIDLVDHFRQSTTPFVGTFPTHLVRHEDHGTDRRIDYIFASPNLLSRVTSAKILRNEVTERLSDHIPVVATLKMQ